MTDEMIFRAGNALAIAALALAAVAFVVSPAVRFVAAVLHGVM